MTSVHTTHVSLLARLADDSDKAAWSEFCDRYSELIRAFARRRGLQAADADDVVQNVLLKLSKSMPRFEYDPAKGRFRSYLKTIVLRSIFDGSFQVPAGAAVGFTDYEALQAASREDSVDAAWEVEWQRYHVRQAMRSVVMEFSARDVRAFQAFAIDGADGKGVAESLGMSLDQVYQAKSQILRRICALVEQQVAEEG